jgi:hypothetical protein
MAEYVGTILSVGPVLPPHTIYFAKCFVSGRRNGPRVVPSLALSGVPSGTIRGTIRGTIWGTIRCVGRKAPGKCSDGDETGIRVGCRIFGVVR